MGDPPPRKRLKLACGDAKIAISVLATCSVKDACKAAEEAFERKGMLKKRKVRTFMLMPDEIELDELELVADVVEDELLQPIFEDADDAAAVKHEPAEPSSAASPLLEVTFVLASAPSDCPKIVRAHGFAAIRAAIVSKCGGGGAFQQGVAVGLFTFNGIELPAIEVDGCEIISDFLAEIQANGGEGSRRTPSLWVVVGDVQGCKKTSERFGLTEAWQPEVIQTDKAISSFLATLSVVTAHAPKKAPDWLTKLSEYLPFPPTIEAMSALFRGEKISPMQKKAVASSLYHFIKPLLPEHVPRDEILGYMHSVAAFVVSLKSAGADTGVEKNAKEKKEERDFGLSKFFALHESKALFKADAAKFLRSIPTLRLRDYRETPCLMEHDSGLAVYCGIPGCSVANVTVFLPLEDGHQEIDPQILAKRLAELGHGDLELSCPEIDDRPTLEGVCVVYDMSTSMSLPAFPAEKSDDGDAANDLPQSANGNNLTADEVRYDMYRLSKFEHEGFQIVSSIFRATPHLPVPGERACLLALASLNPRIAKAVKEHTQLVVDLMRQRAVLEPPKASGSDIQIFVKGAKKTNNDLAPRVFKVTTGTTILQLMDCIALSPDGCPLENQRLAFGGKWYRAEDDEIYRTLDFVHSGNGSTVLNHHFLGEKVRPMSVTQMIKVYSSIDLNAPLLGQIECKTDDKIQLVSLKIWAQYPRFVPKPDKLELWTNCSNGGDGFINGRYLDPTSFIGSCDHVRLHVGGNRNKKQSSELSRIETTKQLFHAFINRSQAYNIPNQLGLILFSDKVERSCEMTKLYEKFREDVDRCRTSGDTKLWDAIIDAQKMLVERFAEPAGRPLLRILVLTDGSDSSSSAKPWQVAKALLEHRIVLDAILIGEGNTNSQLIALVKASNGYAFAPETIVQALELCELETLLSMNERPVIAENAWRKPGSQQAMDKMLVMLGKTAKLEDVGFGVAPTRRQPSELSARSLNVSRALSSEASKDAALGGAAGEKGAITSLARQRLMQELRHLSKNPHPAMDVFPVESNLAFWNVVMTAPKEDSCLYAGGTYMLYIQFPEDYPQQPPIVRIQTPILHLNVNQYGRVCHSILSRDWSVSLSVRSVLDCVYGLLLAPDPGDSLDSKLALLAYRDFEAYKELVQPSGEAISKTRAVWLSELDADLVVKMEARD